MIILNGEEVKFEKFPNGETRFITDGIKDNLEAINEISFKYEDDSDLIKLMFVKNYIDTFNFFGTTLVIYYMPYSRMDRSENDSAFTLKYVSDLINKLNFRYVRVIEPHSDVTPALLNNVEAKYINFDLLPKAMDEIGFDEEKDYVMFPDLGASKRYSKMKVKNELVGHKHRDFKTGRIESLEVLGSFNGSREKVIIVDDLSSYGGTFVKSAEALKFEGFKEIYLLVAHAENSIFKGELFNHIDKVFTTDSILTDIESIKSKEHLGQLKVFNIKEVIK